MSLTGKRLLVTGVLTRHSIGYAVAEHAQLAGAHVTLTGFGRTRRMTERAARGLPSPVEILELDVNEPSHFDALHDELERRWGSLDGALHSIAFAPPAALGGNFLHTSREDASTAFLTSAFSLKALAVSLAPLMEAGGGSVVGLDFDASVSWPVYDWMGVAKAALESTSRYLARYLGPRGVRVNLVSAGPIASAAATGIPGFQSMAGAWELQAPLGWDAEDATPVAEAACFLMSDAARAITGEILHVDGGHHAMGGPMTERLEELDGDQPMAVVS
jgi:meromycolic acid enoyl-[acyl-carrier-protein] reductase